MPDECPLIFRSEKAAKTESHGNDKDTDSVVLGVLGVLTWQHRFLEDRFPEGGF